MSEDFWNDERVKEFVYFKQISWPILSITERMEQFKDSKKPKPLFTTEDGVGIHCDTEYWQVEVLPPTYSLSVAHTANSDTPSVRDFYNVNAIKKFSFKEKAKEYILLNKPIQLSFNELQGLFTEEEIYPYGNFINKLKKFFKSKVNP